MKCSTLCKSDNELPDVEYAVYIHYPDKKRNRLAKWERASTTNSANLAFEQAQMLLFSEKYEKIEVQKKFFCKNSRKKVGHTLHVYKGRVGKHKNPVVNWLRSWLPGLFMPTITQPR